MLLDVLGEVPAGHALVDVLVAGQRVELLDPRLDVVASDPFAGVDGGQVDLVDHGPIRGQHLVGVVGGEVHAEVALRLQHSQPQLPFGDDLALGSPEVTHGG